MIPFPIFLGSNITEGQISRVKPPPEAFTEANYGESGSELLTADVRTNQAKTGGMHGDEWCRRDGCGDRNANRHTTAATARARQL